MIEQYDSKMIRCPRVGGDVNFKFCRSENNLLPCRWVVGCWQMRIEISQFLEGHFSKEELDRVFAPPKPKMESLVELVEKARNVDMKGCLPEENS